MWLAVFALPTYHPVVRMMVVQSLIPLARDAGQLDRWDFVSPANALGEQYPYDSSQSSATNDSPRFISG